MRLKPAPAAAYITGKIKALHPANGDIDLRLRFRAGSVEIFDIPAAFLTCHECNSSEPLKSSGVGEAFCRSCHAEYRDPQVDENVIAPYIHQWPTVSTACKCRPEDTNPAATGFRLNVKVRLGIPGNSGLTGLGRIDFCCSQCHWSHFVEVPAPCHPPINTDDAKPAKKSAAFTTKPPEPGDPIYVYDADAQTAREASRVLAVIRRLQEHDLDLDIWTVAAVRTGLVPAVLDIHKGKVAEPKTIVRGDKTIKVHGDRKAWFPADNYPAPNVSPKVV